MMCSSEATDKKENISSFKIGLMYAMEEKGLYLHNYIWYLNLNFTGWIIL